MGKVRDILESGEGARLTIHRVHDALGLAAELNTARLYYRGTGETVAEAMKALDADIEALAGDPRRDEAREIVAAGRVSPNGVDGQYYVRDKDRTCYLVRVGRLGALCYCADFKGGGECIHVMAAGLYEEREALVNDLLALADELERASWYDAVLVRSIAEHGLVTWQQRDKLRQLREKHPGNAVLARMKEW